MKKLKLFLTLMLAMFVSTVGVHAACREVATGEEVAEAEGEYCDTLNDAFTKVSAKGTVKLLKDIHVTENTNSYILVSKEMTIDFNTHTLTIDDTTTTMGILVYYTATFKNGSIVSNVRTSDSSKPSTIVLGNRANLTLENMRVESTTGYAINAYSGTTSLTLDKNSEAKASVVATIIGHGASAHHTFNIYGKVINTQTYSALEGHYQAGDVNINVYEGAEVVSSKGAGILHMSPGNVIVENGSITGNTAIIMTKGNLDVKGGTIKGTGDYQEFKSSADYQVFDNGAAIYIEPAGTIEANITGGSLQSDKSYAFSAPATEDTNAEKLTVSISDGNFEGELGSIQLTGLTKFVTGGTFGDTISPEFISEGSAESESGVVGKLHNIEITKSENGKVETYKNAAEGEEVVVKITADKDYELDKLTILDKDGKEVKFVSADDGVKFTMPASNVTISATFKKIETPVTNTTEESNPKTGDSILMYLGLGLASVAVVGLSVKKLRKFN